MDDKCGEQKHHTGQFSGVPVELRKRTELLYVCDEEKI